MKKGALLERLLKEKPAHEKDEIDEALRRGYSVKQIIRALTPEMEDTEVRQGKIFYSGLSSKLCMRFSYATFGKRTWPENFLKSSEPRKNIGHGRSVL